LHSINFHFDVFNSFAVQRSAKNPAILEDMYDLQLVFKGLLFNSVKNIRRAVLQSGDGALIRNYQDWETLKEKIAKAYIVGKQSSLYSEAELRKLEDDANNMEAVLSTKASYLFNQFAHTASWKEVRDKLRPNSIAVEIARYSLYNDNWVDTILYAGLYVSKETTDHPHLIAIGNGNDMDEKYLKLYNRSVERSGEEREVMPVKNGSVSEKQRDSLYNIFWSRLEPLTSGYQKIYFSPDGVYNLINVNSLKKPGSANYVFDMADIRVVNSTADLLEQVQPRNVGKAARATLFGNPQYRGDLLYDRTIVIKDLPCTKKEVENIGGLLKSHSYNVKEFQDSAASENNVKKVKSPFILHLATHGFYLADTSKSKNEHYAGNPMLYVGLLFAGAEATLNHASSSPSGANEDGILTAYEVENLDLLNTNLVVLSACETGQGDLIKNGEGTFSLERAFRTAGARSVLYSLWRVNDEITQQLMTEFYNKWLNGLDKRTALIKAQLVIRAKYPDPFYWASFVLIDNNYN